MNSPAVPYMLKPAATKLPEGDDPTLEPTEAPTDPAARGAPAFVWPSVDASSGATDPPDGALAPPGTDPAIRGAPAFVWPRLPQPPVPNRPVRSVQIPDPDLDPDIDLWPRTVLNRWPFTGSPTTGIYPTGWLGVDNRGVVFVCTLGGQPGTWMSLNAGGGVNATALQGTPISATAPTVNQILTFIAGQWTPAAPATPAVQTPIGSIVMWPTNAIPTGWFLLNGQTIIGGAATFAALAAAWPALVVGSDLVLPNYQNMFPAGAGGAYPIGSTGGSPTLSVGMIPQFSSVAVSLPSLAHSHGGGTGFIDINHNHSFPSTDILTGTVPGGGGSGLAAGNTVQGITGLISSGMNTNNPHNHGIASDSITGASGSVTFGSASPASSVPPFFAANYIVKAQ